METKTLYACPRCQKFYELHMEMYGDESVTVPAVCRCGWRESEGPRPIEMVVPVRESEECPF